MEKECLETLNITSDPHIGVINSCKNNMLVAWQQVKVQLKRNQYPGQESNPQPPSDALTTELQGPLIYLPPLSSPWPEPT